MSTGNFHLVARGLVLTPRRFPRKIGNGLIRTLIHYDIAAQKTA